LFFAALKGIIPPIIHFTADEPFTKYEICLIFSYILALPHGHIIPDDKPPTGEEAAPRPRDCRLYTGETEHLLGVQGGLGCNLFEEWWREYLRK